MFNRRFSIAAFTGVCIIMSMTTARGDEGMWVFNNLPLETLKARYGFVPPPGWAEHLRSAAVRFNNGGSGSFVSADGLIMTNHHVGADTLAKLSTSEKDYYKLGFHAKTRAGEVKAPDLELNVLVGIEDVTAKVNAGVAPGMDDAAAATARRKVSADIEKESTEKTGLRSDVVTLYQGGQYHLYTYKKYTDVRLVFAPEFDIAFFGGDPDNFEYPRYCLDACFFRAYENDKPAQIKDYLKWSPHGSKDGELVFVAGHPGRTDRLNTLASVEYLRDSAFPFLLDWLHAKEAFLLNYGKQSDEAFRQSKEELFSIQNSRKARTGGLDGLKSPAFMDRKRQAERDLRSRIEADPAKKSAYGAAWDKIAEAQDVSLKIAKPHMFLERGRGLDSTLFQIARDIVRLTEEKSKPNSERLKEYRDSALESLELELFSTAPIYPEFERAKFAFGLAYWKKAAPDGPVINRILAGRTPEQVAAAVVGGTKLGDVAVRRKLVEGGKATVEASDDPMIRLAREVDADARSLRKVREDQVEGVEAANYALIAKALFAELGDAIYPDATFTLRLAFGAVKGYTVDGKAIPPFTTIGGAFDHEKAHDSQPPYVLPKSWHEAKATGRLDLATPFNFVSTADIIGGNSGSPVVNKDNEVVGLIFDGNIQSLVLDFGYEDVVARAVSVDSRGIVEALRSVYQADDLVKELTGR
ncbi:S46 family peptidase [Paludisphaera rhizosphaerae]|uniref:S46 family peptidase n=1 Tax=Paludisphaera rhizosphaerae TaxID=2711216 RepID=UPI0013E9AC24|nr:S46 family peptidase [Paludisphaera rhizosphaerae]